jgi:hypothetical protein|tara:strand:- start:4130 stop:4345 length:216 start_codon:yes stop_codon:yes gene_type:complete
VYERVENSDYGDGLAGWNKTRVCQTAPRKRENVSVGSNVWRGSNPEGCVMTYRYVDVFVDGAKAGHTYYWN